MNRTAIETFIRKHESVRYTRYFNSRGVPTIGIGFDLDKEGAEVRIAALGGNYREIYTGNASLDDRTVNALFTIDLSDAISDAKGLVRNFRKLPEEIQMVIVDMIFSLSALGFGEWTRMITALELEDYCIVADEMVASSWAKQMPNRALDDISVVRKYCRHPLGTIAEVDAMPSISLDNDNITKLER